MTLGAATAVVVLATAFPAVTLHGIGGVIVGTPLQVARARWHAALPASIHTGGSQWTGDAVLCAGDVEGVVRLSGTDSRPFGRIGVLSVLFTKGARTDAGVGIGSTKAEVRKAYGLKLQVDVGVLRLAGTKDPRATIVFYLGPDDRVSEIGYGRGGSFDASDLPAC
jgi:hypothetical protein